MTSSLDLTTGSIRKKFWVFFLPVLASSLFQQLYTTVDSIIVGQITGKSGLAAIDAVSALLKLPVNFFDGIAAGTTIIISQYFGAAFYKELKEAEHTGIAVSFAGGFLLSVFGFLITPFALKALGVPSEIFAASVSYVKIYFAGLGFSLIYNICAGLLRAVGNTRIPFRILVIAGILNVILDFLFVGPMNMGVAGAALATVIAQAASAILALRALAFGDELYRLRFSEIRFHRGALRKIFILGLPTSLQNSLYPVANMIVQASINALGADVITAWGLVGKMDMLLWLCIGAFGPTVNTFAAQNIGAGQPDRARRATRYAMVTGVSLIIGLSFLIFLFVEPLCSLFISGGSAADVIPLARLYMNTQIGFYFTYVFGSVVCGMIQGEGNTIAPMLITLLGTCIYRILWIFLYTPHHPGMIPIIACYPISWMLTSAAFLLYYRFRFLKKAVPAATTAVFHV